MIVIPAIDILGGKVARLTRGDFKFEKIYEGIPLDVAKRWKSEGASMIHIVDLDGAKTGSFKNLRLIGKIASSLKIQVELGGGLRDRKTIKEALDIGIRRVIIGTRAIEKDFLKKTIEEFGKEKIVVGVDSRGGRVSILGWTKTTDIEIEDFLKELEALNVKTIIFTDILKDGTLKGPNIEAIEKVLDSTQMSVIASGGISSVNDILELKKLESKGLVGCIIGKALYEGRLNLKEAIKVAS